MNVTTLMGRMVADPTLKKTPNDLSVCSFTIAVDKYTNGERKADFINIVAWRQTAEFVCKYFKKGSQIALIGEIQTRQYEEKETGKKRTAFEVLANKVFFAGGGNGTTANKADANTLDVNTLDDFSPVPTVASDDGDLPF